MANPRKGGQRKTQGSREPGPRNPRKKSKEKKTRNKKSKERKVRVTDAELQEWCLLLEVALPFAHLDASDGSISPLDHDEMEELKQHIQSGHSTKSHKCKGCLTAEGPRRIHRRVSDIDRSHAHAAHRHSRTIDKIR